MRPDQNTNMKSISETIYGIVMKATAMTAAIL